MTQDKQRKLGTVSTAGYGSENTEAGESASTKGDGYVHSRSLNHFLNTNVSTVEDSDDDTDDDEILYWSRGKRESYVSSSEPSSSEQDDHSYEPDTDTEPLLPPNP